MKLARDIKRRLCAIDELRHMVTAFGSVSESFLEAYELDELVQIYRAWMASAWDFTPDFWETVQVREAIRGIVPRWEETRDGYKAVYR